MKPYHKASNRIKTAEIWFLERSSSTPMPPPHACLANFTPGTHADIGGIYCRGLLYRLLNLLRCLSFTIAMLILLLLAAVFKTSSSLPLTSAIDALDAPTALTIFGRQLPKCLNPASQRTIQDIVWSCIATIFACTWVAVHPNVSDPCTSGWEKLKERVKIMVCALLAPELVTLWALRQRIGAEEYMVEYNDKYFQEIPPARSILQSIMDWFGKHDNQCHRHHRSGPWTLTHGFLLEMHGLRTDTGNGLLECVESLPEPVSISEAEISDKSKGDFLTKLFVILQTAWFIFQVLARWATHLKVTDLEVITLGFALLNLVTYALWWNKPQNMQVPIYVDVGEEENEKEDRHEVEIDAPGIRERIMSVPLGTATFIVTIPLRLFDMLNSDGGSFYSSVDGFTNLTVAVPMALISLIFGVLHFIPLWTSSFPSTLERVLWLISAVCIITEPILLSVSALIMGWDGRCVCLFLCAPLFLPCCCLIAVGGWLYVVARSIIITLAFTTLRDLPPQAYQNVDWTTFIPHF